MVTYILAAVGFFALILVSVGFHELGHFIPAKLSRVKVRQFYIGFGKNLWKTQRGETEYGIKLIPLGGYCAIEGMLPPKEALTRRLELEAAGKGKNSWLQRVADSAREADWETIDEADVTTSRLFYQRGLGTKLLIMAGGVGINLLLSFGLFLGVNLGYGSWHQSLTMDQVIACVDEQAEVCEPTPAAAAGLQVGDTIVEFNGVAYQSWTDLAAALRANGANPVTLVVDRAGQGRLTLPTVPGAAHQVEDPNDATKTVTVGYLGVVSRYENVKTGPIGTLQQMGGMVWESIKAIAKMPVSTVQLIGDLITGQERDPNGPISVIGAAQVAGEVAVANIATSSKVAIWLSLLAGINLFVACFNLVPLLPFDGGHVAAAIYSSLRRWIYRLLGKADPGQADTAKLLPVAYVIGGFVLIMGVVFIVADILSPVSLF